MGGFLSNSRQPTWEEYLRETHTIAETRNLAKILTIPDKLRYSAWRNLLEITETQDQLIARYTQLEQSILQSPDEQLSLYLSKDTIRVHLEFLQSPKIQQVFLNVLQVIFQTHKFSYTGGMHLLIVPFVIACICEHNNLTLEELTTIETISNEQLIEACCFQLLDAFLVRNFEFFEFERIQESSNNYFRTRISQKCPSISHRIIEFGSQELSLLVKNLFFQLSTKINAQMRIFDMIIVHHQEQDFINHFRIEIIIQSLLQRKKQLDSSKDFITELLTIDSIMQENSSKKNEDKLLQDIIEQATKDSLLNKL